MTTQSTARKSNHGATMAMVGAALLVAAISTLLLALNPTIPADTSDLAPAAVVAPQAGPASRQLADEAAGAAAQYSDPAAISGPMPERLQDLARPAAPAAAAPQVRISTGNRIFADEIAAGAGASASEAPTAAEVQPQLGPR